MCRNTKEMVFEESQGSVPSKLSSVTIYIEWLPTVSLSDEGEGEHKKDYLSLKIKL